MLLFVLALSYFFFLFFLFSFDDRNDARPYTQSPAPLTFNPRTHFFSLVFFFFPFVYFLHMLRREYYTCRPGDARLPTPCWEKKREGTIAVYNINSKQLTRTSEEGKQQQQQSKKKRKRTKEKFLARPALYISFHCCAAYIRILSRPPTSCLESAMASCVFSSFS